MATSNYDSLAIMQAINGNGVPHMTMAILQDAGFSGTRTFYFDAASAAADETTHQLGIKPSAGRGFWIRADSQFDIKVAVTFNTADAAVLCTVPTGMRLRVTRAYWEVTANWTGGTSSTVGMSSSSALANTKGDIEGGAAGDLAAVMVTTNVYAGAIGTKLGSNSIVVLNATNTIRFDRITSAFTAGTGFAHINVEQVAL